MSNSHQIVAHIFWNTAPYLTENLVQRLDYLSSVVYVRDVSLHGRNSRQLLDDLKWVKSLPEGVYAGQLEKPWILRRGFARGYLGIALELLFTEFSFKSWRLIIRGPRNWCFHGKACNLSTMLLLRLFGKKVVLIHWGGLPSIGRYKLWLDKLAYGLYRHIFVLISPELRYFTFVSPKNCISVLPYPPALLSKIRPRTWDVQRPKRWLLIGNNGLIMKSYEQVLDFIRPGSWEKIICMLNYGESEDSLLMRTFISKYKAKFGDGFFPWITTLPYEEYLRLVDNCCAYICPWELQSGLGAAFVSARQGKAVIVAGDNYKWLKEVGVAVHNISELNDYNFESVSRLIPNDSDYSDSMRTIANRFEQWSKKHWQEEIGEVFQ